jgi:hypothetical protein
LEGQALVCVAGEIIEDFVEAEERLPPLLACCCGDLVDEEVFQVGYALTFPDLVGQADEQVVDGPVRGLPGAVGAGEADESVGYVVGEQQGVAGWLVCRSGTGQFRGMGDFADVVGGRADSTATRSNARSG